MEGGAEAQPGLTPPLPLQFSQLCDLQLDPGKAGFRAEVRSQAPAPATPLLPLESQPVSAMGRGGCFRCGWAGPSVGWQTGPRLRLSVAARHALAPLAPSLFGHQPATSPGGLVPLVPVPSRAAIADGGGLPHAAPPFSAQPHLVRVFTLFPALPRAARLGLSKWGQGPGGKAAR